jgi:hypothetical protein
MGRQRKEGRKGGREEGREGGRIKKSLTSLPSGKCKSKW